KLIIPDKNLENIENYDTLEFIKNEINKLPGKYRDVIILIYYKIINFLLKNKKISVSSIFNDFEFPYNEGLRILRLLKKHNIVIVEDKRIVCLNLDESE
ncbi:MAG: hypothetical protein QW303_08000, partial [Nitrososphaerota archaeon]